ncbi:plasmid stability protein StbB [Pigmentiphaga sp. NML030171]|nr:plasmid stability protein StbB [Pigmentiphaga sp. NML030171]
MPEEVHRAIRVRAAMHGHSTAAEVRGILEQAARPEGKRRTIYLDRQEHEVLPAFSGRILPFDLDASRAYSDLMTGARKAGKAIGKADGYIAASALARGFAVTTRDTSPLEAAGLTVINPWK